MMKRLLPILLVCLAPLAGMKCAAQEYLYDAGIGLGMSTAYGDINQGKLFYNPGFAFDATFRYKYNLRWAFTGELLTAGLAGDSKDFANRFPDDVRYTFSSRLWQLSGNAEFNFFNYGIGASYRNLTRFTPYISVGLGLGGVSGSGSGFSFSLPLGVGVKYRFAPRWNMTARWVFAKTFTDKADGIKDPYGIVSSGGKNSDWYSTLGVGVSYEFGSRRRICNNL
jgi:hypothetical protein